VALLLLVGVVIGNVRMQQQMADPMRVVPMTHSDAAPNASGIVVISSDGEYGAVIVENLPPLPTEKQYQLWLIEKDQRTSGAVFSVSDEGYQSVQVEAPQPLEDYDGCGITVEPAGGSPGPTGERVLAGNF
jgi:anti-sigma-K factor RskA